MRRHSVNRALIVCVACIYLVLIAGNAFADNRTENIDLFLVVDKSLSMQSKIGAVKEYIDQSVIKNMLIPGDHLVIIDFWGQARVLLSETVGANRAPIEKAVNSIQANGDWTDIGNALDKLKSVLDAGNFPNHRKYFMLITDGIQDAPPTSKYYSPNGTFNNAFLSNTKTIQKKGWKIEILGIGTETAAAELAKNLSGGFATVSNHPTAQEIQKKTQNFLGLIQASDLKISPVRSGGKAALTLKLASSGYTAAKSVDISDVTLEVDGHPAEQVAGSSSVTVAVSGTTELSIPIVASGLTTGTHGAKVTFTFSGNSTFSPAVFDTKVTVYGFIRNNLVFVAGGAALVIVLVLLAIFLVSRSVRSRKISFRLTIEGDLKQSNTFVLKSGSFLSIQDTPMGFRAVPRQIDNPSARVAFDGTGLRLEIVNTARLKGEAIPANVLGERVHLKTNAQKDLFLQFDPS